MIDLHEGALALAQLDRDLERLVELRFSGLSAASGSSPTDSRARCEVCGHERLIPFSCNARGVCPSCNAHRMCEAAAHRTDHVLPHVPARQWVLAVAKRLRPCLHHDAVVSCSGQILFLGTEFTQRYARRYGSGIVPD